MCLTFHRKGKKCSWNQSRKTDEEEFFLPCTLLHIKAPSVWKADLCSLIDLLAAALWLLFRQSKRLIEEAAKVQVWLNGKRERLRTLWRKIVWWWFKTMIVNISHAHEIAKYFQAVDSRSLLDTVYFLFILVSGLLSSISYWKVINRLKDH